MSGSLKRVAGLATAVAASAAMLLTGLSAASAADTPLAGSGNQAGSNVASPTVVASAKGSITLVKATTPDKQSAGTADGAVNTLPEGATPLAGVKFVAIPVTDGTNTDTIGNLTTNADWQNISKLEQKFIANQNTDNNQAEANLKALGLKLGTAVTPGYGDSGEQTAAGYEYGVTDSKGTIVWGNAKPQGDTNAAAGSAVDSLPLGLYLIEEVGVTPDFQSLNAAVIAKGASIQPSVPFLVTVPITSNGSTGTDGSPNGAANSASWNYDPTVYPKNTVVTPTKGVDDNTTSQIGQSSTWTVNAQIAKPDAPSVLTGMELQDPVDSNLAVTGAPDSPALGTVVTDLLGGNATVKVNVKSKDAAGNPVYTPATTASGDSKTLTLSDKTTLDPPLVAADGTLNPKAYKLVYEPTNVHPSSLLTYNSTYQLVVLIDEPAVAAELANDYNNDYVTLTFKTTTLAAGVMNNSAIEYPNIPQGGYNTGKNPNTNPPDNPPQSNLVQQKFGSVNIQKYAADGQDNSKMDGAQFQVVEYVPTGTDDVTCSDADVAKGVKVTSDGVVSVDENSPYTLSTSGKNILTATVEGGSLTDPATGLVYGLRASDFADSQAVTAGTPTVVNPVTGAKDPGYLQYCLIETKAAPGYSLQANPIPFTIKGGDAETSASSQTTTNKVTASTTAPDGWKVGSTFAAVTASPASPQFGTDGAGDIVEFDGSSYFVTVAKDIPAGVKVTPGVAWAGQDTAGNNVVFSGLTFTTTVQTVNAIDPPSLSDAANDPSGSATATTFLTTDVTVSDVPVNGGFQLPFTGSTGANIIWLTGFALVAGSVVAVVLVRRRSSDRETAASTL